MNKRVFLKNTAVMTVTSLLLRTLGIVFRIFISNRVGAEGMGLYQLVFSVYVLGAAFASSGLSIAVTRMVAEQFVRGSRCSAIRVLHIAQLLCVIVGVVSAGLLYWGAPLIGGSWIGDIRAVPALAISGIALPFIGFSSCIKGYFMARRRAAPPCYSQLLEQAVRIGGILYMLYRAGDCSLSTACLIIIVGDAVSETVACFFLYGAYRLDCRRVRREYPEDCGRKRLRGKQGLLRPMMSIALPITAGHYLGTLLRTVENILVPARLTLFTHSDEVSLSQFGAVKGMALPLLFFPAAFLITLSSLLVPELSDAYALAQKNRVRQITGRALQITLLGSVWIGCLFTVFGRDVGQLLYHDNTVGLLLQILGPLAPVMYLESVSVGMLKGLNQQVSSLRYSLTDSAVRIGMIWWLLPLYGLTGFLLVMLVSNLLTSVLNTRRLLKVSGVRMRWRQWIGRPVLIAALGGAGWRLLGRLWVPSGEVSALLLGGLFVSAVYILLLPALGCFTREDWRQLTTRTRTKAEPAPDTLLSPDDGRYSPPPPLRP